MKSSILRAAVLLGLYAAMVLNTTAASAATASPGNVMFIFDASGSMKQAAGNESRIDAAKRAFSETLQATPADGRIGLTAFGHRRAKDCTDIEVVSPIASDEPTELARIVEGFKALGETPIAGAIDRAGRALKAFKGQSNSIVLVTDGNEECGGDPCAAAQRLIDAGIDVKIHVVGFALTAEEGAKLQCLVEQTGGKYFGVEDTAELSRTLTEVTTLVATQTTPTPPKEQMSPISSKAASRDPNAPAPLEVAEIVKGRLGESDETGIYHYWKVNAPPGKYLVVLDLKLANNDKSNIKGEIIAFTGSDQLGDVLSTNVIEYRTRAAAGIEIKSWPDFILRVGNNSSIVDYWLGLFPTDAEMTSPYFVRTPRVEPLEIGVPVSTVLNPRPEAPAEAWYSVTLQGADYRLSLELTRSDRKQTNVQGVLEAFSPIGAELEDFKEVCRVWDIAFAANCSAKLSLADEAKMLFRLSPLNDSSYEAVFKIEPYPEQ